MDSDSDSDMDSIVDSIVVTAAAPMSSVSTTSERPYVLLLETRENVRTAERKEPRSLSFTVRILEEDGLLPAAPDCLVRIASDNAALSALIPALGHACGFKALVAEVSVSKPNAA